MLLASPSAWGGLGHLGLQRPLLRLWVPFPPIDLPSETALNAASRGQMPQLRTCPLASLRSLHMRQAVSALFTVESEAGRNPGLRELSWEMSSWAVIQGFPRFPAVLKGLSDWVLRATGNGCRRLLHTPGLGQSRCAAEGAGWLLCGQDPDSRRSPF